MAEFDAAIDAQVRRFVYEVTLERGSPPSRADVATGLGRAEGEIEGSFIRLQVGHVLVLQPGSGEILMAPPFSAVPTTFEVRTPSYVAFGNCVWDALGILAVLHADGIVRTACGCCGEASELQVRSGALGPVEGVVHFAVPAKRWWDDVVFT